MHGHKETWVEGESAHFEYHCYESPESADAPAWYRSHQLVTVLRRGDDENYPAPFIERMQDGCPNIYRVRFADGLEWDVFEDELLTSPEFFTRPDPPKP